jgi:uncharacterized protein (TIGR02246 family)
MTSASGESQPASASSEETAVRALYHELLESWNRRDAAAYAGLFETEATVIGFDGSSMSGSSEIEATLRQIFADHITAAYIGKVRRVGFLGPEVAILHAVVGMVPPGKSDINPAVNALQTLVASRSEGQWRIAWFQNTPAQFHGRPEAFEALSEELRQLL